MGYYPLYTIILTGGPTLAHCYRQEELGVIYRGGGQVIEDQIDQKKGLRGNRFRKENVLKRKMLRMIRKGSENVRFKIR